MEIFRIFVGDMKETKYTHVACRCNSAAKQMSIYYLKKCCRYTLSTAYNRFRVGKGLLSLEDQETIDLLRKLLNRVRQISCPMSLPKDLYLKINGKRERLAERIDKTIIQLEPGRAPLYLQEALGCTVGEVQGALQMLGGLWSAPMNKWRDAVKRIRERCEDLDYIRKYAEQFIVFDDRITIRVGYDDRRSDSRWMRELLLYIIDVPSTSRARDRQQIAKAIEQVDYFISWKKGERQSTERRTEEERQQAASAILKLLADVDAHVSIVKRMNRRKKQKLAYEDIFKPFETNENTILF